MMRLSCVNFNLNWTTSFKYYMRLLDDLFFTMYDISGGEDVLRVTAKKSIISDLIRWSKNENDNELKWDIA